MKEGPHKIAERVLVGDVLNLPPGWDKTVTRALLRLHRDAYDLAHHASVIRRYITTGTPRPIPTIQHRDFISAIEGMERTLREMKR